MGGVTVVTLGKKSDRVLGTMSLDPGLSLLAWAFRKRTSAWAKVVISTSFREGNVPADA